MTTEHGGDIYSHDAQVEPILDFSVNINPCGPPSSVLEAVRRSMSEIHRYPDPFCRALRKKIAKHHQINPDQILCGNGASDLIYRLVYALRPEKAIVLAPCFSEYEAALRCYGTKVQHYNLNPIHFRIEEDIFEKLTEEIDLLCLCNPNNPTGITVEPNLLREICVQCQKKHIFLLLDECFLDFHKEEKLRTMIPMREQFPNLFILRAFTKMYAMAGLRLGYGICADTALLEQMYKAGPPWNVSIPAQEAGMAALQENGFVEMSRLYIEQERNYVCKRLTAARVRYWESEANYILLWTKNDMKEKLLARNILIRDCSNYRNLSKGYYRIAVKSREENEHILHEMQLILQK